MGCLIFSKGCVKAVNQCNKQEIKNTFYKGLAERSSVISIYRHYKGSLIPCF